jgi:hypothetical protein
MPLIAIDMGQINSTGRRLVLRWCMGGMLGYKRITHSEDECNQNIDVVLDMWPYKIKIESEMMIFGTNLA